MKAVKRFKCLVDQKRPALLSGSLGKGVRTLRALDPTSIDGPALPPLHKSKSVDLEDRRTVEGALAAEGVHHDEATTAVDAPRPMISRMDQSTTVVDIPSSRQKNTARNIDPRIEHENSEELEELRRQDSSGEKGHAHDPLNEAPLFLGIGTGANDISGAPPQELVAESPTAAEFSIYDTAYQNEVDRIRAAQGHEATIYLTRRVDSKQKFKADENMVDVPKESDVAGGPQEGWKGLLDRAREKTEKIHEKEERKGTKGVLSDIATRATEQKTHINQLREKAKEKGDEVQERKDAVGKREMLSDFAAKAMDSTKYAGESAKAMGKDLGERTGLAMETIVQMAMEKRKGKAEEKESGK